MNECKIFIHKKSNGTKDAKDAKHARDAKHENFEIIKKIIRKYCKNKFTTVITNF